MEFSFIPPHWLHNVARLSLDPQQHSYFSQPSCPLHHNSRCHNTLQQQNHDIDSNPKLDLCTFLHVAMSHVSYAWKLGELDVLGWQDTSTSKGMDHSTAQQNHNISWSYCVATYVLLVQQIVPTKHTWTGPCSLLSVTSPTWEEQPQHMALL